MIESTARTFPLSRAHVRELPLRWFSLGIAATATALTVVLAVYLRTWPPHEDEALALFVGRGSLSSVLHTVIAERGGAPLHFLLAWAVVHAGGGLTALRAVSLAFAVASVPAIAALGVLLRDRLTGLVAAVLASGTWVLLFHGIYGRMYSLFLFTSTLSFIALLDALAHGGRKRFAIWGFALLLALASHPYAALVFGAQALYVVLRRQRTGSGIATLGIVAVAAIPFWWADLVLRNRFDVGLGGGGSRLGSPGAVARYFWWVAGDFSAGHHAWSAPVLVLAAVGFVLLARRRRGSALLTACVVCVPASAFMLARLGSTTSPEARHLIFALPFFSTLLATAIVELGRLRAPISSVVAAAAVVALVVGEVSWAHRKTPPLFDGAPAAQTHAAAQASTWLASSSRSSDVLYGYEPLYLGAWGRNRSFSQHALPRADPRLLAAALRSLAEPLGRGVWVFDASDTTNVIRRPTIPLELPQSARDFVARSFGPYLVIRSRAQLGTRAHYLTVAAVVMRLGLKLQIGDAAPNLAAIRGAARRV